MAEETTVTFYDTNRDGKLSEGEKVAYYTVDGFNMSPGLYDAFSGSSDTLFSDIGSLIDYARDNPFEMVGMFLDNVDNAGQSTPEGFFVDPLTGEYRSIL